MKQLVIKVKLIRVKKKTAKVLSARPLAEQSDKCGLFSCDRIFKMFAYI